MKKKIIFKPGVRINSNKPIIKQKKNDFLSSSIINTKETTPKPPKYKFKILTGNGSHKALVFIQGVLCQKDEELRLEYLGGSFPVKLHSKLFWVYKKYPHMFEGVKNYICYPKLKDGIIKRLDIVLYSLDQVFLKEKWEFVGEWSVKHQKLTIQRDINNCQLFPLPQYIYNFANATKWKKSLWDKYCYQIIAQRDKDVLNIINVKCIACPIKKPGRKQNK